MSTIRVFNCFRRRATGVCTTTVFAGFIYVEQAHTGSGGYERFLTGIIN